MPRVSDEHLARRRVEILAAAARCFARDGFQAASMDDIVAECGLSAGSVYRYFAGKDELIAAVVEANLSTADELFADLLADGATPSPAQALDAVITALTTRGTHHPITGADTARLVIHIWGESLHHPQVAARTEQTLTRFREHYAEVARRWQRAGHLPTDADPTHIGAVLMGIAQSLLVQRLLVPNTDPSQYLAAVHALFAPANPACHHTGRASHQQ